MRYSLEPFRRVVSLSAEPIYYVHADKSRPVYQETLECGHMGNLVEKAPRMPRKRRCWKCLLNRGGLVSVPSPSPAQPTGGQP